MTEPILYPGAKWKPLTGHSSPGTLAQRNTVVLHITAGSTMEGAFNTFQGSIAPHRVSAHFIIDRDGTVYQLLSISDTAWHCNAANGHTIGVEHVAIPDKLMATEAQYQASAALVRWLCQQIKVPCDRAHVRSHYEVDQTNLHVRCCTGALDPDRVVAMAATTPS